MTVAQELTSGSGTARDTLTLGTWTAVSRGTGVLRILVIGAVLGPTFFGNTYQLTNTLPNLIYYGFLAGSLFCSLLVPAIVRHIDAGESRESARVSGGFLGVTWVALLAVAPLAVLLVPELLRLTAFGHPDAAAVGQVSLARLLIVMMVPQVFLYAVIGTATSVMYAHRRFALPAAAPAVENLAIIGMLGVVAVRYGSHHGDLVIPTGELLLLGLGSTAAVALHAALQWWGARRVGVRLRPLAGWRDPDVMNVVRRAVRSVLQAGLLALQLLAVLLAANRAAGGTVALQIAFNFYYLPLALVATPVALALLPRLSRLTPDGGLTGGAFTDTYRQGLGLALFLVVPAACGYVVLAGPVSHVVAVGQMNSPAALTMLAGCLAVLALGLAGETTFYVTTQACYARRDTRTPLVSMSVQAAVCLLLAGLATLADPDRVPLLAGGAYAAACLVGGAHLFLRSRRQFGPGRTRLWPSAVRIAAGALVMAGPVYLVAHRLGVGFAGGFGELAAVVAATLTGLLLYALVQAALRAPELAWLLAAVRRHRDVKTPEAAL